MSKIIQDSVRNYGNLWDEFTRDSSKNKNLANFINENRLTKNDYTNIGAYTSRASRIINKKIREGTALSEYESNYKSNLISALNKCPSLNNKVIFRDEEHDNTVEIFLKRKKKGETIRLDFFVSTYQDELRNPKNGLQIVIQTKIKDSNVKDVSLIGKSSEKEALILNNTIFQILNIDRKGNRVKLLEL